jgi:ABC-type nitrate/sulfonate/bicarbonate transport system permease component
MNPMNEINVTESLLQSLMHLLSGYIPAMIVGVPIGVLAGLNSIAYPILKRILQIPAVFPALVLIPTALSIFQSNQPIILPLVIHSAVWWIAIYSATATRIWRQDRNPSAAIAALSTGLRFGMAMAWLTIIAIGFVASGVQGIGFVLLNAYNNADLRQVTNATIAIGVVGFLLNLAIDLSTLLLSWFLSKNRQSDDSIRS